MLSNYIYKLSVITRAKDWRLSFVPFIMGCVYLWLWWFKVGVTSASIQLIFLSLVTIFGFAALGYYINDYFDMEADARAFKINKLSLLTPAKQILLLLSIVLVTFLPWIALPSNEFSWMLIAFELLLFLAYSLPFPRLKEKLWLSLLIDALYAYVVPLILLFHTYNLFVQKHGFPVWFLFFLAAAFFIGIRNIFLHQIVDVISDKRSGISTLPMQLGVVATHRLLFIVTAYEVLFVLIWSVLLYIERHFFILWLVPYCLIAFFGIKKIASPNYKANVHLLSVNQAYQYLFPILTLLFASVPNPEWIFIVPLHVSLMVPFYYLITAKEIIKVSYFATVTFVAVDIRNGLSIMVNYPVYYAFRIFGVDLRKEQQTASQYLVEKLKRK